MSIDAPIAFEKLAVTVQIREIGRVPMSRTLVPPTPPNRKRKGCPIANLNSSCRRPARLRFALSRTAANQTHFAAKLADVASTSSLGLRTWVFKWFQPASGSPMSGAKHVNESLNSYALPADQTTKKFALPAYRLRAQDTERATAQPSGPSATWAADSQQNTERTCRVIQRRTRPWTVNSATA